MSSRSRLEQRSLGSPENVFGSSEARNYLYKTAKTKQTKNPDVMAHICHPNTWLRSSLLSLASLGYMRPCLQTNKQNTTQKLRYSLPIFHSHSFR